MNQIYGNITIVLVVYIPDLNFFHKQINLFSNKFKIVIVDLSPQKFNIKEMIEDKKNILIINGLNNGQGYGHNLALRNIHTKYALYVDIDAEIDLVKIKKLYSYAEKIKDFSILVANTNNKITNKRLAIIEDCDASVMLYNINTIKKYPMFDEKIFLYFEEKEYFSRLNKTNNKVYIAPKVIVYHHQGTSSDIKLIKNLKNLQQWHYLWSMFYVNKKMFGFLVSLKKILPLVLVDFVKMTYYFLQFKILLASRRASRLSGAFLSILGFPSFKRPKF
jgi:GT2 family glycosyltransferase